MKNVLITGANKGIGYETARQLLQKGYYVLLGSRNLENGLAAADKFKAEGLNNTEAWKLFIKFSEVISAPLFVSAVWISSNFLVIASR